MSIIEFLAGIPVNAVLRERIAALIEDNERLSKQVVELEQENAELKKYRPFCIACRANSCQASAENSIRFQ